MPHPTVAIIYKWGMGIIIRPTLLTFLPTLVQQQEKRLLNPYDYYYHNNPSKFKPIQSRWISLHLQFPRSKIIKVWASATSFKPNMIVFTKHLENLRRIEEKIVSKFVKS